MNNNHQTTARKKSATNSNYSQPKFHPAAKLDFTFDQIVKLFVKAKSHEKITLAICALQFFSTMTTVKGAGIILSKSPAYLAWTLGGGLQAILILLLVFKEKKEAGFRRWSSILFLVAMSIYTSFFSLYDDLLGGELSTESPKKVMAHQNLRATIYTPLETELQQLQRDKTTLTQRLQEEALGGRGAPGIGPKWQAIRTQLDKVENRINEVSGVLQNSNLQQAFSLSLEEINAKTPKELFENDMQAWSLTRPLKNAPAPLFSDYQNADAFLVPFQEVRQKNANAIAALVIAASVDLLSLILGSISPKEPFAFFKFLAGFIVIPQVGFKRIGATYAHAKQQENLPFEMESNTISDSTRILKLVNIDASEFLRDLLEAINFDTYVIDFERLMPGLVGSSQTQASAPHESHKYREIAYRLLFDTIRCKPFEWLEEHEDKSASKQSSSPNPTNPFGQNHLLNLPDDQSVPKKWRIKKDKYRDFITWLRIQMSDELIKGQVKAEGVVELHITSNPIPKTANDPD
jgi:hypothetical protein